MKCLGFLFELLAFTDVLSTGVAVLGVQRLVAGTAVRPALSHDVALTSERRLALEAAKVPHVPVASLRLRALVRQNDLSRENGLNCSLNPPQDA